MSTTNMTSGYKPGGDMGILRYKSVVTALNIHAATSGAFDLVAVKTPCIDDFPGAKKTKEYRKTWNCHGALDELTIAARKMLETAIDCALDDRYYRDLEFDLRTALDLARHHSGVKVKYDLARTPGDRRDYIEFESIADEVIDAITAAHLRAAKQFRKAYKNIAATVTAQTVATAEKGDNQ